MKPDELASRARDVVDGIRAGGHQLRLRYAGVSTAYGSDEDVTAGWIGRFFEGYLLPTDGQVADLTVYSTGDPVLFAALQRTATGERTSEKYGYAELPLVDSVTVVRRTAGKVSPPEDVYLLLFERDRTILLVTSGNIEVRREEAMQVLRAAAKWALLERGWIPMHSACAAKNGRTICVAGPKASGKTSTLLNLLARNGCDLVAVDKFLVRDGGSQMEICGMPGKIGIRIGTAIAQPRVLHWLGAAETSFFPRIGLDEVQQIAATHTPEQLRTRKEKIHLLPAELAGLFDASIVPTAPLHLLLVPVFDVDLPEARLAVAEPEQATEILTTSYAPLLGKGEGFLRHFFDLDDAMLQRRLAELLGTHLPSVTTRLLHQNHRTNEQAADLVAGLL